MKSPPDTRDRSKYCEFHRDHGHSMEDCQALQRKIESLIKRGLLRNYIGHDKRSRNDRDNRKEPGVGSSAQPTVGTINIIIGGIASGGDTNNGRKQYAHQHTHTSKESCDKLEDITFGGRDLERVSYPHDDALVVSAIMVNFEVKRILIDNGSEANILSHEAFNKIGLSPKQLKAVKTPLQGFGGGVIIPEDIVELPLTLGFGNTQVMEITPFQVVNTPMTYNIILERPLLNKIQAFVSTFYLAMKFPTGHGIGVVRGDQTAARQCYITSIRGMSADVMQLSNLELELELEPRDRLATVEELEVVELELEHRKNGHYWSGSQAQPLGGDHQLSVPQYRCF
ncbi:uncharacterized protein LOC111375039 [Olea europaea var. sylvestris]|uniref:uncharacterized protein LOC111375039 n=1 Tax=Olea europaea var. sylvestris TaxID=158386 RepID=UPI000C1D78DD|nr:uncharacterized protein LOC111375039 [Olea europaea var. sylvestris]